MGALRARSGNGASLIGVVDDDESVREALSSLLRSAGYKCALFSSAEAFLVDSHNLDYADCMILDVQMPGLSGLDLQLKLREMSCRVPIVFVTAHADSQLRARVLGNGAIAVLNKPFNDEGLLGAIRAALASLDVGPNQHSTSLPVDRSIRRTRIGHSNPRAKPESESDKQRPGDEGVHAEPKRNRQRARKRNSHYQHPQHERRDTAEQQQPLAGEVPAQPKGRNNLKDAGHKRPSCNNVNQQ
jgi:CheY-like chemotaxis protein